MSYRYKVQLLNDQGESLVEGEVFAPLGVEAAEKFAERLDVNNVKIKVLSGNAMKDRVYLITKQTKIIYHGEQVE